jgi:NitT/TauT family transport system permease protein
MSAFGVGVRSDPKSLNGDLASEADDLDGLIVRSSEEYRTGVRNRAVMVHVAQVLILVVVIGAWEGGSRLGIVNKLYFSRPSAIIEFMKANASTLWSNTAATLEASVWGYVLGCIAGVLVGLVLAELHTLDRIFDPFFTMLNSLPRIALAPLLVLWFGISMEAKVALAVSLVFFILVVNTRTAARSVDPDLMRQAIALGGTGRQRFFRIVLPGAMPGIIAGLRLGIIYALFGVIASEMVIARNGLGTIAIQYMNGLNTPGVFSVLAITAVIALFWNAALVLIENFVLRHRQ